MPVMVKCPFISVVGYRVSTTAFDTESENVTTSGACQFGLGAVPRPWNDTVPLKELLPCGSMVAEGVAIDVGVRVRVLTGVAVTDATAVGVPVSDPSVPSTTTKMGSAQVPAVPVVMVSEHVSAPA